MAVTLVVGNGAGTVIGPGVFGQVSGLAGPTPVDDKLTITVSTAGGLAPIYTTALVKGLTTINFVFGQEDVYAAARSLSFVASGTAVTATVIQQHANNTIVGTFGPFAGFTWEPDACLAALMAYWAFNTSGSGLLNLIYAAVAQIKTTPGQV